MVIQRPNSEQHFCADKGYDYEDDHQIVIEQRYQSHIKHRRRRNESKVDDCSIPGEKSFPARRWIVESCSHFVGHAKINDASLRGAFFATKQSPSHALRLLRKNRSQ
jgi:hypothetical protein